MTTPDPSTPEPTGFVARIRALFDRIQSALTYTPPTDFVAGGIAIAAWIWLDRVAADLGRLVTRIAAGTLRPSRPRAAATTPRTRLPSLETLARPRRFGWLIEAMHNPQPLAAAMRDLLAGAESLFAQAPARFGRLLRPLYQAMALTPPTLLRRDEAQTAGTPPPREVPLPPLQPAPIRSYEAQPAPIRRCEAQSAPIRRCEAQSAVATPMSKAPVSVVATHEPPSPVVASREPPPSVVANREAPPPLVARREAPWQSRATPPPPDSPDSLHRSTLAGAAYRAQLKTA